MSAEYKECPGPVEAAPWFATLEIAEVFQRAHIKEYPDLIYPDKTPRYFESEGKQYAYAAGVSSGGPYIKLWTHPYVTCARYALQHRNHYVIRCRACWQQWRDDPNGRI